MSGIFGFFNQKITENLITDFKNSIEDSGYKIKNQVCNGSCFLGEIGINHSDNNFQIFESQSKIDVVVCGEIYNDDKDNIEKEILLLYQSNRLDQLKEFNGFFAAAIYDRTKEKLTIINDRHGLVKLFYYYDGNVFYFSPKIKPLLIGSSNKSLRKDAIIDFFLFGYLLGDKTFFQSIYQLPAGSFLEVSNTGIKLTKYWKYEYREEFVLKSRKELTNELHALWQKTVDRRIKKDERIILPISGGLDSRAILAAALKSTPKNNIITYTYGEKGSYDYEIGRMVAEKAGVKHIPLEVEKKDFKEQYINSIKDTEGMIDATPYFAINGYKSMSKYGDIIFSGTMIDVLLGRHILSSIFTSSSLNHRVVSKDDYLNAQELIFNKQKLFKEERIIPLFKDNLISDFDIKSTFRATHPEFEEIKDIKLPDYFAIWDYANRWNKYVYFTIFRYRHLFKYYTMLDSDLVDFAFKISPEFRLDENLYISMLLEKYPELFDLPTKTTLGLKLDADKRHLFIIRSILFFKKAVNEISNAFIKRDIYIDKNRNYIDYDNLLRVNKEYREFTREIITRAEAREYFNSDYIEYLWKSHLSGKNNCSMLLGLLVTFELFLENFVDS